jgi:hypothetical protein
MTHRAHRWLIAGRIIWEVSTVVFGSPAPIRGTWLPLSIAPLNGSVMTPLRAYIIVPWSKEGLQLWLRRIL